MNNTLPPVEEPWLRHVDGVEDLPIAGDSAALKGCRWVWHATDDAAGYLGAFGKSQGLHTFDFGKRDALNLRSVENGVAFEKPARLAFFVASSCLV